MTERERIRELEEENALLRERLTTERLVCRAKCLLVEHRSFTEEQAHHHIEKLAMDGHRTRRAVAQRIIEEYSPEAGGEGGKGQ